MDELAKTFVVQAPMVAVLIVFLKTVYDDWKIDRQVAAAQRDAMTEQLNMINKRLERLEEEISSTPRPIMPPKLSP